MTKLEGFVFALTTSRHPTAVPEFRTEQERSHARARVREHATAFLDFGAAVAARLDEHIPVAASCPLDAHV